MVDKGAISIFLLALTENVKGVVDQAIWAIGNFAADRAAYRDYILKSGGLVKLIKVM